MNTYTTCKKVIENMLLRNTLDSEKMLNIIDVFLLCERITSEEFSTLENLINSNISNENE